MSCYLGMVIFIVNRPLDQDAGFSVLAFPEHLQMHEEYLCDGAPSYGELYRYARRIKAASFSLWLYQITRRNNRRFSPEGPIRGSIYSLAIELILFRSTSAQTAFLPEITEGKAGSAPWPSTNGQGNICLTWNIVFPTTTSPCFLGSMNRTAT